MILKNGASGGVNGIVFAFHLVNRIKVIDLFIRSMIHYFNTLDTIQ
jgi:hypothetical protein